MPIRQIGFVVLLTLVLAALIHIVAVLSLPVLAPQTAWNRLLPLGPANTIVMLPEPTPKQATFPMMAPDIRYAFCRYDLSKGPIRLSTTLQNRLLMIALYTPEGKNFYAVTGADTSRPKLTLVIATADQNVIEESLDAPEDADKVAVVRAPTDRGIALIRAPLTGPSFSGRAETALKKTTCGLDKK